MSDPDITQERLRHLINYDPLTGSITWNNSASKRFKKGEPAGNLNGGTPKVKLDGYNYPLGRLVFMYMEGYYPARRYRVIYADKDRMNLKWDNLRVILFNVAVNDRPARKYVKKDVLTEADLALREEFRLIKQEEARAKWLASMKTPREQAEFQAEVNARNEEKQQHRAQLMRDMQARLKQQSGAP